MTNWLKVKNNAASELAIAITAEATELTLKTGEGSRFPSSFPFHITIDDEILAVTARTDDMLTVTRAQENTSPAIHNSGAAVRLNITAALIEELQMEIDSREEILPLTTKGDLLAFGTALARLAAGSNGQFLQADSTQDLGVKWATQGGFAAVTGGTYTGDSSANRAIPHGLGVIPKLVLIGECHAGYYQYFAHQGLLGNGKMGVFWNSSNYSAEGNSAYLEVSHFTVTEMDANSFYVGKTDEYSKSMNYVDRTYYWMAIG